MPALNHIRHLVRTVGPRGSCTAKEAEAARYAEQVLLAAGLHPLIQPFVSARSAWRPYALFSGLVLVAAGLFWTAGRAGAIAATLLSVVAVASVLLEMAFRPNPLRWLLPRGRSQNVVARIAPHGEVRQRAVMLGHLDTHRSPIVFSTQAWLKLFGLLVPAGLVSSLALIVCFSVGIWFPGGLWRLLSLPFCLALLGVLPLTLQADLTPYNAGANDNASGAGVVLSIAERLARERLSHTEVWAVLSGCEEVGCYGADAFAKAYRGELGRAAWLAVESVGGGGADPVYQTRETFLLSVASDPQLVALAARAAAEHPELRAFSDSFAGAYSEGSIGGKHGFRVLTITAHRHDGTASEWHRMTDTMAKLDVSAVERSESFLWELLRALDRDTLGVPSKERSDA